MILEIKTKIVQSLLYFSELLYEGGAKELLKKHGSEMSTVELEFIAKNLWFLAQDEGHREADRGLEEIVSALRNR